MKIKLIAVGLLLALICCLLAVIFFDGYYLPNKPCRPLLYPSGERTGKDISYKTSDKVETVLSYFDQNLEIKPPAAADMGEWQKEKSSQSTYLYSCYSTDINLLTTETGCIYVSSAGQVTQIRSLLLRTEGLNIPCSEP